MTTETQIEDVNKQIKLRLDKLKKLRANNIAYPNDFKPTDFSDELHEEFAAKSKEELETIGKHVAVSGRIMMRRLMGKASFVHIQDMTGRIQLYLRQQDIGEEVYSDFKSWDLGDIIGAQGTLFKTKTGELSVHLSTVRILTKSLRPLPDKWHGLSETETKYRQRYLDIMVNKNSASIFKIRAKLVKSLREFFDERKFLEVETPMMQAMPGGATARPFVTHHNALDMKLYMRIAPELYLKRLVVSGIDRVYEINRNFRNEGLSTRHNPEFTMIEFYQAYSDYIDLMDLTETLFEFLASKLVGSSQITYQGKIYDFAQKFTRMTVKQAILKFNQDLTATDLDDKNKLQKKLNSLSVKWHDSWGIGKLQIEIFEATVESNLDKPTFITEYPTEVSPLARVSDTDPNVTDRFELFIAGREIANGFSELNDPHDQAERFKAQVAAKELGDEEAMHFDADYITALEYGLPPTAGQGIGIDRLVMLFTDTTSIRDVIMFPLLRPKS